MSPTCNYEMGAHSCHQVPFGSVWSNVGRLKELCFWTLAAICTWTLTIHRHWLAVQSTGRVLVDLVSLRIELC